MQANYIDVTDEWLKNARPNSHKVREMNYFEINGIVYKNDNVKLDFGKREKNVLIGLKIHLVVRYS